jgi:hypothetical protein
VGLVEVGGCVFDEELLRLSRGFESLDPVGREAFVNHLHLAGADRAAAAERVISSWAAEMRARWPEQEFRIYRHVVPDDVTIRFHMVRSNLPNWCEDEGLVEVIVVGGREAGPNAAPDTGRR